MTKEEIRIAAFDLATKSSPFAPLRIKIEAAKAIEEYITGQQ